MKKLCFAIVGLFLVTNLKAQWAFNGASIYNSNSGNVGIGTTVPGAKLEVFTPGLLGSSPGDNMLPRVLVLAEIQIIIKITHG